ncbi:class I SAM-dependent DNA methyltransferase [Actinomycetospora chlora]|uniref:site-specific DNA-methyltransferase (adenine-specific) n=1 Tax=Actinomycetospora chlora TaxID=663608 RepID=A0ABP9AVL6_9PSEU
MTRFDTIVVGNDFVSEHWLAEQFSATVTKQRAVWKEREEHQKVTPRSALTALAGSFGHELVRLRESGDVERLRELHAAIRSALLIDGEETTWTSERAGGEMTVPAVVGSTPSGTHLLVLQARDAATVEDVLDADGVGHLLSPATVDGVAESATAAVVSGVFRVEDPPALVVVTAGAWLLLAERGTWPEGRWLAVDLATALERRDTKAAGELETIAALVSAESLLPADDGTAPLLGLLEDSVKHAVGVSKDLREGVRDSIELIASEVLRRRRDRGLPDDAPNLAGDLTRQSLRFLYRVLFLLYAEARPELGVLPVGAPEYAEGYGLDRLRELVLTELTSARAREGTHFHQSLDVLFRRVNEGYPPSSDDAPRQDDGGELRFEALRADLFDRSATLLIDEVGLGNACLRQVLRRLLLSKEKKGRDAGFVSYAQLGINQLGAVYEGLMSYSGSIARDHMVEVAKDGDRAKGSWVVPISATEGFEDRWFVTQDDPENGDRSRVTYRPGDFVFRLSGRDRQRSASYYTPEVLTRCVVTHSLAELLTDETPAAAILQLAVCEPALGSGAFLIEAINQLADQYLSRRQRELDKEIPPERYPAEKQKVKAYLALHNCYGVDLNATAVELAEITLWLDAMHPGLQAPWFGLHLRRGNSLIGARREVYTPSEVAKKGWLTTVPTARPLGTPIEPTEIHHFLLPAAGWGAVADTKEAKEGRPRATVALKDWRRSITSALSKDEIKRLQALAQRVEVLWSLAQRRLTIAEAEVRRDIAVWGADDLDLPVGSGAVQREDIEASFDDPDSAYRRLRRVMDAWAAMWFWPVDTNVAPPTRSRWLDALEALLGTISKGEVEDGRGLFSDEATWSELDDIEANERSFGQMRPSDVLLISHPWLYTAQQISEEEGFFHWQLDFAQVFTGRGGFDLQIGNPPWVRPDWDDGLVLAEDDPWFELVEKASVAALQRRREALLDDGDSRYLAERTSIAGSSEHLSSAVDRPLLAGLRPDLYRCFMDRAWRGACSKGIVGLIHPESHFTELRASSLRQECYRRLRRHWHFRNELSLFEVHNTTNFGVHIYGQALEPHFSQASLLFDPMTLARSLQHDGTGPEPGLKDDEDRWDTRPHANRILTVDVETLATWADIIDEPGTPATAARMLRPITAASQKVLEKIATAKRFSASRPRSSLGWDEAAARKAGFFESRPAVPDSPRDVILLGPNISVANPFARQVNPSMRSNKDYTDWDLEQLPERPSIRTSYQRIGNWNEFIAGYPRWEGRPTNEFWRLAWRRMANPANMRTLFAALIPPGPTHVSLLITVSTKSHRELAFAAGMWASLPVDFLIKAAGFNDIKAEVTYQFPHPSDSSLAPEVIHRALRLNCLTSSYGPLWEELFDDHWRQDSWTISPQVRPIARIEANWSAATPLRRDADRRRALVELDALSAVVLGISAEELSAIYRTQFGVLRKYERVMQFDANGFQVPREVLKDYEKRGTRAELDRYELPFIGVDREREMTIAHEEFSRRLAERTAQ